MPVSFPIPQVSLPPGSRTFGPASVPDGDSQVIVTIDRTPAGGLNSLTAVSTLALLAEMSTDGGASWHAVDIGVPGTETMFGTEGGPVTNRAGVATESAGWWPLFPGTGRRVRATVTVGGPSSIAVAGSIATQ